MRNRTVENGHEYLYWEFYEQGGKQAIRSGHWKAVRMPMHSGRTELYDLSKDLGEGNDVAAKHADLVRKFETWMDDAHTPHPNWKPHGSARRPPMPGDGKARF